MFLFFSEGHSEHASDAPFVCVGVYVVQSAYVFYVY